MIDAEGRLQGRAQIDSLRRRVKVHSRSLDKLDAELAGLAVEERVARDSGDDAAPGRLTRRMKSVGRQRDLIRRETTTLDELIAARLARYGTDDHHLSRP